MARHRADYEALRKAHLAPPQKLVSLETARKRRTPSSGVPRTCPSPRLPAYACWRVFLWRRFATSLTAPRSSHLGVEGIYLAFSTIRSTVRRRARSSPKAMRSWTSHREGPDRSARRIRPVSRQRRGDDVDLYTDGTRAEVLERFHFLRQQANREGSEPCRSLADLSRRRK